MSALAQAGSAYVEVEPSFDGFVRKTATASDKAASRAARNFNSGFESGTNKPGVFRRIGGGIVRGIGKTVKVAAVGAGTVAGIALVGGFKSAIDQQHSRDVLSGLYGSMDQAKKMMKDLRKVSQSSSLDYSSYTKAAGTLAYAGVQGKDAVKTLKNVGKAISAAGGNNENLNSATDSILKMVNAGKVQLDTLQQLSNSGVPILSGLAKHFGVSISKVNEMASEGKIKLDDVLSVMRKGTGSTFQKMIKAGNKADNSLGNVFKRIKDNVFTSIGAAMVPMLDKITPIVAKAGKALNKWLNGQLKKLPGLMDKLSNHWREFKQGFAVDLSKEGSKWQKFGSTVRKIFDIFTGKGGASGIGSNIKKLFKNIDPQAFKDLFSGLASTAPLLGSSLSLVGKALGFIGDHAKTIGKILPFIAAGFLAWKAASSFLGPQSLVGFTLRTAALFASAAATAANTREMKRQRLAAAQNSAAMGANTATTEANTAAQSQGVMARIRQRVATIASTIAQRAAGAAARVAAAGQWLLNAAMNANPISIIIIALIALGAAFVVLWRKSTRFREIVKGAWEGIKKAALAVWHWMKKTLWPGIKWVWDKISGGFKATGKAISDTWKKIKGYFSTAWSWVKGFFKKHWMTIASILLGPVAIAATQIYKHWDKIKGYFKAAWRWVKGTFKGIWHGIEKILTDPIGAVKGFLKRQVRGWKNIFSGAKKAIGKIWDGLKNVVKAPVNWVIKHVINHPLISGINALLPGNPIKPLKGFAKGTDSAPPGMAWVGERGPELMQFAGGERIYPAHVSRRMADRFGDVAPGFARGGRIPTLPGSTGSGKAMAWSGIEWYRPGWRKKLVNVLRQLQSKGWSVLEMMPFDRVDPVHSAHSLHYLPSRGHGNAADISRPGMKGADRVARMLEAMGFGVKWRAPGHFNHIHVDTSLLSNLGHGLQKNKGGGGGFFSGIFGGLWDKVSGLWDKVSGKFKDNKFVQIPIELGKKALSGLWDRAKSLFNPLNWFGGDAEGHGKLGGNVAAKLKVKSAAAMYGWDHGYMWDAIKHIVRNESSWNPHARNPSSGAYGLFQALPPSKMNSVGRDWRTNADTQARWGMRYIAQRYGNPARAWDFWTKHHWYAGGTRSARPGLAMVGERGPELISMRGGERVFDDRETQRMLGGYNGPGVYVGSINAPADTARDLVDELTWAVHTSTLASAYSGVR